MKLVLKMLQNITVVIKTTTACVWRRAKDGVASAAASGRLALLNKCEVYHQTDSYYLLRDAIGPAVAQIDSSSRTLSEWIKASPPLI